MMHQAILPSAHTSLTGVSTPILTAVLLWYFSCYLPLAFLEGLCPSLSPSVINFKIHYLRNFIFGFPINYNWSRGWLYSLRKSVRCSGFEHGHMEDWINRAYRLWKMEGER